MAEDTHYMNPAMGRHLGGSTEKREEGGAGKSEGHKFPNIHVHSHAKGHTVHILHHDGTHEKHEHPSGDADGIAEHVHQHIGQDHGYSSGEGMENEVGAGSGV